MDIKEIPISQINPAKYNPRKMLARNDPAYKRLKKNLDTFGLVEPLVWNKNTGNLVSGHQRLQVLKDAGRQTAPVSIVDLDDAAEKALNVAMNTHAGDWDYTSLADLIAELGQKNVDLELTGVDPSALDKLQAWPAPANEDREAPPERKHLRIETVEVSCLQPHARNYLKHPDDQLEHLIKSIRENGYYRNIVTARDYTILAGHGIFEAVRKMGWLTVPVIRLDVDKMDPQALKVLTGDNCTRNLAEVDDRALSVLLKEVKDVSMEGLLGTGFDEMMLANLIYTTRNASEIKDHDEAKEWAGAGMPGYDTPPTYYVRLCFRSSADMQEAAKHLGLEGFTEKTHWWPTPATKKRDTNAVCFEDQAKRQQGASHD
jgi:ParB-like chromosome segregation protein Spo0J